jgi:SRSO17 transposase
MPVSERGIIEVNEAPAPLELTPPEMAALADELRHDHAALADLYYRTEQAHWAFKSRQGLMLPIERKAIEPLALEGANVQAMQHFIGQGQWQDTALLRKHWALGDETLGEADGVWIPDGSDFPKQGEHSVGVARQWCGHVGKVEPCQAGVCAAYASRKGYTRLDRRLYLPEEWFDAAHRERWKLGGIPQEPPFTTKPALALAMRRAVGVAGTLRFRWVAGDDAFGRDTACLDGVAAVQRWYCAEVPHDTQVWLQRPATAVPAWLGRGRRPRQARLGPGEAAPQRGDQLAAPVPRDGWQPYLITEGRTGPLVAECAFHRGVAVRAGLPGPDVWIILRRALGEDPKLKVYLSNAPVHTLVVQLVRVAGMRWPIETAVEERQGGLGLEHDEVRS